MLVTGEYVPPRMCLDLQKKMFPIFVLDLFEQVLFRIYENGHDKATELYTVPTFLDSHLSCSVIVLKLYDVFCLFNEIIYLATG